MVVEKPVIIVRTGVSMNLKLGLRLLACLTLGLCICTSYDSVRNDKKPSDQ
jgi:hypothetical protein